MVERSSGVILLKSADPLKFGQVGLMLPVLTFLAWLQLLRRAVVAELDLEVGGQLAVKSGRATSDSEAQIAMALGLVRCAANLARLQVVSEPVPSNRA